MRLSPLLIGMTMVVLASCQSQIPSVDFRQSRAFSDTTATGETVDSLNETTPKNVDSLEVSGAAAFVPEVHTESGSIFIGSAQSSGTLRIYDDYGCFYCREFGVSDTPWIVQTYVRTKKLAIERIFVPRTPVGILMAKAALCSEKQGLFMETDTVLHARPLTTVSEIPMLAKTVKMNLKALQTCMASAATTTALAASSARAKNDGITRFPSFGIGIHHWSGVMTRDELKAKIESAL